MSADPDYLSDEAWIALAHADVRIRAPLAAMLELDGRLARIVSATTEPMLGQMRLAWWRDTLKTQVGDRPRGDAVIDSINQEWRGHEDALIALVDAWEQLLDDTLERRHAQAFATGRGAPFAACARMAGKESFSDACHRAGKRWALADAAVHVSDDSERQTLLDLAREDMDRIGFPRPLRGLAVLDALARRSIDNGGRALMHGRGAALVATRAAIIGR